MAVAASAAAGCYSLWGTSTSGRQALAAEHGSKGDAQAASSKPVSAADERYADMRVFSGRANVPVTYPLAR